MDLNLVRKSANIHKQIVGSVRKFIKPNQTAVIDICKFIENEIGKHFSSEKIYGPLYGIAFPVGININNVAAHDSAWNNFDKRIININDIVKIDFGVHMFGNSVDSAFTLAWNNKYFNLMKASKEGLENAIKVAGVDARLGEISNTIVEVVNSFDGIKTIKNIGGHNILPYTIHAGKSILCDKSNDDTKMNANEVYAIEVFSTMSENNSVVIDYSKPCTHYSLKGPCKIKKIFDLRRSLPFANRWFDKKEVIQFKKMINQGICIGYPPLICDSYTSQFEHTLIINNSEKVEVVTQNDFY